MRNITANPPRADHSDEQPAGVPRGAENLRRNTAHVPSPPARPLRWLPSLVLLALPALAVSAAAASRSGLRSQRGWQRRPPLAPPGDRRALRLADERHRSPRVVPTSRPARIADLGWQIRGHRRLQRATASSDVLWHHQTTGDLYVWLMAGTSVSGGAYLTPSRRTDIGWQVKGVADLERDAQARPALAEPDRRRVLRLADERPRPVEHGFDPTPAAMTDPQWQLRGLADFNGDGQLDVLWHHQMTGDLYVWFMNGTTATGARSHPPALRRHPLAAPRPGRLQRRRQGRPPLAPPDDRRPLRLVMNGTRVTGRLVPHPLALRRHPLADRATAPLRRPAARVLFPRPLRAYEDGRPRWKYNFPPSHDGQRGHHPGRRQSGSSSVRPSEWERLEAFRARAVRVRPDGHRIGWRWARTTSGRPADVAIPATGRTARPTTRTTPPRFSTVPAIAGCATRRRRSAPPVLMGGSARDPGGQSGQRLGGDALSEGVGIRGATHDERAGARRGTRRGPGRGAQVRPGARPTSRPREGSAPPCGAGSRPPSFDRARRRAARSRPRRQQPLELGVDHRLPQRPAEGRPAQLARGVDAHQEGAEAGVVEVELEGLDGSWCGWSTRAPAGRRCPTAPAQRATGPPSRG